MSDYPLPLSRFSADTHLTALNNLSERYEAMAEPVYYKEAALGDMDETTCSSCLNFFSEFGLLNKPNRGVYEPREVLLEYADTDFSPESEAFSKIRDELETNNEIFQEAVFFLGRESIENDELAVRIVEQEEELEDDEVEQVQRFLEINEKLNFLRVPDSISEVVGEGSDTGQMPEQSASKSKSTEQVELGSASIPETDIELSDLPSRGDPNSLIELCEILKDGGTWSKEELINEDEIDYKNRKLDGNLHLGIQLGFVEENDEGEYLLSDQGYELAFEGDTTEASRGLFRSGLQDFPEYLTIIDHLESERAGGGNTSDVENTEVIQLLRTEFSIREPTEDPLKRATTQFFKTLEAGGFGEYKAAGGGYPTRFGVGENYTLTEILNELTAGSEESGDGSKQEVEGEDQSSDINDETDKESSEKSERIDSTSANESEFVETASDDFEPISTKDGVSADSELKSQRVTVEVNVDLNIADMDTAELEAKLELLEDSGVLGQ